MLREAGINLQRASIRHIDTSFVLTREGDYRGLFTDADLLGELEATIATRPALVAEARAVLSGAEPEREMGDHCTSPFSCEFAAYCSRALPPGPEWPVTVLPNGGGRRWLERGVEDLLDLVEGDLNDRHARILAATRDGRPFHDAEGARRAMEHWGWPRAWLDFETIAPAIPRWVGTRPYQQIPFQFWLHLERRGGRMTHHGFLSCDGCDPRRACAEALVEHIPEGATIIAYNAAFERRVLRDLAAAFPDLAAGLEAMAEATVDLLPIARNHWYHRDQRGSWSITRLVRMLDIALGLDLDIGAEAAIARQKNTLLEILIDAFATRLLAEVWRGLPRAYIQCEEDLPALRGRLDVTRQFTRNAVRPDRLACRFDQLEADTPLMRVMAAATAFLVRHTRTLGTRRKLDELRHALADIPLMPITSLPWQSLRIDRTNRRWEALFRLARLLLQRDWQATHHAAKAPEGLTLLFPMNDLFEKYIAVLLRRALAGTGIEVIDQGGHRACLGAFTGEHLDNGDVFRTMPDIILRRRGEIVAIIDTKWKKLSLDPLDRKQGVSQADVYQLMAYARLYRTAELMLLYPARPGEGCGMRAEFGMAGGSERLRIAAADVSLDERVLAEALRTLVTAPAVIPAVPSPLVAG